MREMDRRNIVSGVLICLVLVNFALVTTITIRDIDSLIEEFDNFLEHEGTLDIFFTCNISQQIDSEAENLKYSPARTTWPLRLSALVAAVCMAKSNPLDLPTCSAQRALRLSPAWLAA